MKLYYLHRMAKTTVDIWDPDFIDHSPIFYPIAQAAQTLINVRSRWPSLAEYQETIDLTTNALQSQNGKTIRFVPQASKEKDWLDDYEPRIFLKGEVQTRLQNWHDFFQVLVWSTFPKTKVILNALHYAAIKQRMELDSDSIKRSSLENVLTQFDECGAIVVSSDEDLLNCIRGFRWKELFWLNRNRAKEKLRCFVFGHATYEKALTPYIGLTSHSILFSVDRSFFNLPLAVQIERLDEMTHNRFSREEIQTPKDFQPFPLLGVPGWDSDNNNESYYDNSRYFRPGRRHM